MMKRAIFVTVASSLFSFFFSGVFFGSAFAQGGEKRKPTEQELLDKKKQELLDQIAPEDEFEFEEQEGAEAVDTGLEDLLDNVVVTATRRVQAIAAAPAVISVITASQIRRYGYKTVGEALHSVPGLYLITNHTKWNLGVRGVNGGQRADSRILKVMIDGQPVSFRPSTENWLGPELIPISAVQRIEIIRGPNSALYGANAFLGVVNIITTNGALVGGGRVTARMGIVGDNPGGGGEMVVGMAAGNVDILFSGSLLYSDRSGLQIENVPGNDTYGSVKSQNDSGLPASLFLKMGYRHPILGSLNLDFNYQRLHSHAEFADWGPLAYQQRSEFTSRNRLSLTNMYARLRMLNSFWRDFSYALSATFSTMGPTDSERLAVKNVGIADFVTRDFGTTSADIVGEFSYTLRKINTFTVGVDYASDWHELLEYANHFVTTEPPRIDLRGEQLEDRRLWNFGAFFQSIIYPTVLAGSDLLKDLGFTVGVRYDHHNIYGDQVNYRLGSVLTYGPFGVKALFGTSFKAPAPVQLFTNLLQPGDVIGNEDLEPEEAKTGELQLAYEFLEKFNVSLTAFYSVIDNKVELVPRGANISPENVATITSVGGEGEFSFAWRGLSGYTNLSYQRSQVSTTNVFGEESTEDTGMYPSLMAKVGASYEYPRIYLGASFEASYISTRLSSPANSVVYDPIFEKPYELDPYFTMDLSLFTMNVRPLGTKELRLAAKVKNITGQRFLYPGFADFDIPSLGRTFWFSLSMEM